MEPSLSNYQCWTCLPDGNNIDSHKLEPGVHAIGEYEGSADATLLSRYFEMHSDGRSTCLHPIMMANPRTCRVPKIQLSCLIHILSTIYNRNMQNCREWSPAISLALAKPIHLMEGVHVIFTRLINNYAHGDLFYIPAKSSRHHGLEFGIRIAFGSDSGYSPGDQWHLKAKSEVGARGPLRGNTEMVIRGSGFLRSHALCCKLTDPRTMHTMIVRARHVSYAEVRCITKLHPADMITDPNSAGFVTVPCMFMEFTKAYVVS